MSNVQIPNLPVAIALNGTEQLEAVQAGTSVRVTTSQIASLAGPAPTVLLNVTPGKVLGRTVGAGTGIAQELPIAVDASGNVVIGGGTPFYKFAVTDNVNGNVVRQIANGSAGASANAISQLWVNGRYVNYIVNYTGQYIQSSGIGVIISYADFDTHIWRNNAGTERMRITADGKVGIGTSTPDARLAVYDGTVPVQIISGNGTVVQYVGYASGSFSFSGNGSNHPFGLLTNNIVRIHMAADGKVGVGTVSPDASSALDVTSTTGGVLFPRMTGTQRDAIGSPANGLVLYNTTTNKLQVRAAGAWVDLH